MPLERVLIVNALDTAYPHLLWNLANDTERLANAGVYFKNTARDTFFGLPSHEKLARQLHNERALEHYHRERLADWLAMLAHGAQPFETLLLVMAAPWASPLVDIRKRLMAFPALKNARFQIIMSASPQEVALEQRLRLCLEQRGEILTRREWLHSDIMNLASLTKALLRAYGEGNMALLAGASRPCPEPGDSPLIGALYEELSLAPSGNFSHYRSWLDLACRETRQIYGVFARLNNAWPKSVTPASLLAALKDTESSLAEKLDYSPMLSPGQAMQIREACAAGNSRTPLAFPEPDIAAESLDMGMPHEWRPWTGLTVKTANPVLEALPPGILDGLHEALGISQNLLTRAGRNLLMAMTAHHAAKMRHSPGAKVCVLVQTYNHEKYIGQALDSILAQQTNFDVDIVVLDDASTDGAQAIIEKYAGRHPNIRPVFLRSHSKGGENNRLLLAHAISPYVALCDGDDYFTDPFKLQRQADFLDSNPACSLCFHPVRVIYEDGSPEHLYPERGSEADGGFNLDRLMGFNFIQSNSVMYRWRFRDGLPDWFCPQLMPSDWYWHLLHAEIGEIGFLDKPMSVYRRHGKSLFWRERGKSSVAHRLRFGIQELRLYEKVLEHFGAKAAGKMQIMANGVFADLTRHYMDTEDDAPLQKALRYFPAMGKNFLNSLKI